VSLVINNTLEAAKQISLW